MAITIFSRRYNYGKHDELIVTKHGLQLSIAKRIAEQLSNPPPETVFLMHDDETGEVYLTAAPKDDNRAYPFTTKNKHRFRYYITFGAFAKFHNIECFESASYETESKTLAVDDVEYKAIVFRPRYKSGPKPKK